MEAQIFEASNISGPNMSTAPITAMGCQQFLPLSVVQLKGKLCQIAVIGLKMVVVVT